MRTISVDESKCKKDGFCVTECPTAVLRQIDKESTPEMVPERAGVCLDCGHCVAICPHGALSHTVIPIESCPAVDKEKSVDKDQAVQFLRSRRTIRRFKEKAVERTQIQQLIEIARYAPTGSNAQPVVWTVFTEKSDLQKAAELTIEWMREIAKNPTEASGAFSYLPMIIAAWDFGMDVLTHNAPALIIASAPGKNRNGTVDLSIALSYLELAAVPMGLGTCWAGLIQSALEQYKPLQDFIGLPDSHSCQYPMMIGYPKFRFHRMPERKEPTIFWK